MLTVLLGGARSGKSTAALELARAAGDDVTFIATSPRLDEELVARIEAHRAERPAGWNTIEAETELAAAIEASDRSTVVIDCLTVWVGNLMHHGLDDEAIETANESAITAASARRGHTIVVSNEVGLGIVPAEASTRRYRDMLGRMNQRWVAAGDRSLFLVAGRALDLTDVVEP